MATTVRDSVCFVIANVHIHTGSAMVGMGSSTVVKLVPVLLVPGSAVPVFPRFKIVLYVGSICRIDHDSDQASKNEKLSFYTLEETRVDALINSMQETKYILCESVDTTIP